MLLLNGNLIWNKNSLILITYHSVDMYRHTPRVSGAAGTSGHATGKTSTTETWQRASRAEHQHTHQYYIIVIPFTTSRNGNWKFHNEYKGFQYVHLEHFPWGGGLFPGLNILVSFYWHAQRVSDALSFLACRKNKITLIKSSLMESWN